MQYRTARPARDARSIRRGEVLPRVMPPMTVVRGNCVKIGRNVVVMNDSLFMAAGGITIDDDVMVAAGAKLISNNHDLYDHAILTCKPVHLKRNCWIGAGATILPVASTNLSAWGISCPTQAILPSSMRNFVAWLL